MAGLLGMLFLITGESSEPFIVVFFFEEKWEERCSCVY